jgi:hypothetical protein
MTTREFIVDENLSYAWARAVRPMVGRGAVAEIAPLCVSITGFDDGVAREDLSIRDALDGSLAAANKQDCHTVANTLFPESLWNPSAPRSVFFERYGFSLPRLLKASKKNRHGMYFQRLIEGGPATHPNQLDFVIETYLSRKGVRRSALQVAVYNSQLDQTKAAQRGFPCLQHVTFAPVGGDLNVNAFYATQYAFERAYGNYLGLCRLGRFVAHELGLTLARVTCFTGIMLRDGMPAASKKKLADAIDASPARGKGST